MINNKFICNNHGLTLLEVLISLSILGIVITSFLSYFNQAYSYTKQNEDKTVGINVARNVLYFMEQQDYDVMKDYLGSDSEKKINIESCNNPNLKFNAEVCKGFFSTTINNTQFTPVVTLKPHSNIQLQNYLIPIEITVTWNNQTATVEGVIKK